MDVNDIAAGAGGAALAIVRSSPPRLVPNEARRDERNAKELPLCFNEFKSNPLKVHVPPRDFPSLQVLPLKTVWELFVAAPASSQKTKDGRAESSWTAGQTSGEGSFRAPCALDALHVGAKPWAPRSDCAFRRVCHY